MTWTIVVASLVATFVAVCGGLLTRIGPWYLGLRKPWWQPPNWAFAPVWTTIFALAVTASVFGWYAARSGEERRLMVILFLVNGAFNVAWSALFFTLRRPDWSLMEVPLLWLSILALIVMLWPISQAAAWALAPYLIWVTIAAYLNWTIVRLNQPFGVTGPLGT